MSNRTRSCPPSNSLPAMGCPMLPTPRYPTCIAALLLTRVRQCEAATEAFPNTWRVALSAGGLAAYTAISATTRPPRTERKHPMAPNLVDYLLYEPEDAGILWTRRTRSISRRSPSRAMRASHDFWSDHPQ